MPRGRPRNTGTVADSMQPDLTMDVATVEPAEAPTVEPAAKTAAPAVEAPDPDADKPVAEITETAAPAVEAPDPDADKPEAAPVDAAESPDVAARVAELERRVIGEKKPPEEKKPSLAELNRRAQQVAAERAQELHDSFQVAQTALQQAFANKRRSVNHQRGDAPKPLSPVGAAAAAEAAQKSS